MDPSPSEAEARSRKWSQAPGNIEDLDEYTAVCTKRIGPYRDCSPLRGDRSIPIQLVGGVIDYGITVYEATVKACRAARDAYRDAHAGALHLLADSRRRKTCRLAESRDIALLPSKKSEVTERNQSLCGLLKLSPELRVQIYGYIYTSSTIITISDNLTRNGYRLSACLRLSDDENPEWERRMNTCSRAVRNTVLTLPITCRQIYTETIHYLYGNATFCFNDRRLIFSLPLTIPIKHLRALTSLCLTFDIEPLTTEFCLPHLLEGVTDRSRAGVRRRTEYVEIWHFLAIALRSLQTLIISFHREDTPAPGLEPQVCKWLLAPLSQLKDGTTNSYWSPNLKRFDVRLDNWWPTQDTFIREYQKESAPFFLGPWCGCRLYDRQRCDQCNYSEDYCLRSTTCVGCGRDWRTCSRDNENR